MALLLFIIIVAIGLGILGVVLKGLFWLLIIGIVLFLANLVFGGMRLGKSKKRGSQMPR
jgi:predicted cobalt transporter CbtA